MQHTQHTYLRTGPWLAHLWCCVLAAAGGTLLSVGYGQDTLRLPPPVVVLQQVPAAGTHLEVDEEANLYVLCTATSRLYKYFHLYGYDSSIVVGGQGTQGESLNQPCDLRAAARNKVYVLDRGNRRSLLLSVNLQPVTTVDYRQPPAGAPGMEPYTTPIYPRSMAVSPLGEVYLLNGEDNQVLKFDPFGQLQQVFGGLNYGQGSLLAPIMLQLETDNYQNPTLYVADTSRQLLQLFDSYGVYLRNIQPRLPFRWQGFTVWGQHLLLYGTNQMALYDVFKGQTTLLEVLPPMRIVDVVARREGLFVLTENQVLLYKNHD